MCRSRSNRTDEWKPFLVRKDETVRTRGWDTGDKRHRVGAGGGKARDGRRFSNSGATCVRLGAPSWSAHTWPRNARSQKTRGTAIVLSAAAAKSARGSLHDRTLPPARRLCPIDSAFLSCVLLGRFRHIILLFCFCDGPSDFSRFLLKWWLFGTKEEGGISLFAEL